MYLPDQIPIICNLPKNKPYVDIYFIHDVHYGSDLFDKKKWKTLKDIILADDNAYIMWIGDLMENAIPNSKSDMFSQTHSPAEQKEWVAEQFCHLRNKTLAVVAGNHCDNRTTKVSGLFPLYDCCLIAGSAKSTDKLLLLWTLVLAFVMMRQKNKFTMSDKFSTGRKISRLFIHRTIRMALTFLQVDTTTKQKINHVQSWSLTSKTRQFTSTI